MRSACDKTDAFRTLDGSGAVVSRKKSFSTLVQVPTITPKSIIRSPPPPELLLPAFSSNTIRFRFFALAGVDGADAVAVDVVAAAVVAAPAVVAADGDAAPAATAAYENGFEIETFAAGGKLEMLFGVPQLFDFFGGGGEGCQNVADDDDARGRGLEAGGCPANPLADDVGDVSSSSKPSVAAPKRAARRARAFFSLFVNIFPGKPRRKRQCSNFFVAPYNLNLEFERERGRAGRVAQGVPGEVIRR